MQKILLVGLLMVLGGVANADSSSANFDQGSTPIQKIADQARTAAFAAPRAILASASQNGGSFKSRWDCRSSESAQSCEDYCRRKTYDEATARCAATTRRFCSTSGYLTSEHSEYVGRGVNLYYCSYETVATPTGGNPGGPG